MGAINPLIVILGPTAVGKTEIAIAVAEALDGEIISADSRTFYEGMDIGTAKPTPEQRVRVPHHLVDISEPDEEWSLARFTSTVSELISDIHTQGKLPFVVGGTGQYIRALVEGWDPPPRAQDNSIRQELEKYAEDHGNDALHQRLEGIDPASAARIQSTNARRVIRAIEIYELTGVPASQQRIKTEPEYRILQIGLRLPREVLYKRIDQRIDWMIENGLLEEVRGLLDKGYSLELPSMSAIGYQQLGRAILGKISVEEAIQEMRKLTRQLVRRQANWFKEDDPNIHWFGAIEGVEKDIIERIQSFLLAYE